VKTRIFDLVNGRFVKGSKEDFTPSYLITPFGEKISRVNIIATVIDVFLNEDMSYGAITLDDGTGDIRAKAFKEKAQLISEIKKGDLVLVIGKVKEFNEEIYVNLEIVRKIPDANQETLRKLQLLKKIHFQKLRAEDLINFSQNSSEEELLIYAKEKYGLDAEATRFILQSKKLEVDYKPKVIEIIKMLDEGEGVDISKIFESLSLPENVIEKTIDELINLGYLFEPSPGKLKVI
jgi:hypothetical protein